MQVTFAMKPRKFWPLDFDLEVEIYDNPAWNLPGHHNAPVSHVNRPVTKRRRLRVVGNH